MDLQLKRIRNLRGLSQEEMAQALDIKTSRYGTWERGERAMSFSQAIACAEILGCSLDELAGRQFSPSFTDSGQAALNGFYDSMNEAGRELLVQTAKSISADPERRIVKDSAEHSSYKTAMGPD